MRRIVAAFALLACAGCEDELTGPEIFIDISPVNLGVHAVAPDAGAYDFDLQLTNRGDRKLVLSSVDYRGDQNCAFTFQGPDLWEMGKDESAFIRGFYEPAIAGEDQIAMEVVSNADNFPNLIVPICALAVPAGTQDAGPPVCEVPLASQPDCEEQ
jgi:hypothetical protein